MDAPKFPLITTKVDGLSDFFDLTDPVQRRQYFKAKVGKEIEKLKEYMDNNSFVAYLLGKKNAGKGTYSKILEEIVGPNRFAHISVGDVVRKAEAEYSESEKRKEIMNFLEDRYRGFMSLEEALRRFEGRGGDTSSLLPTEFILVLVEREIKQLGRKSLFIDGFPRDMDQVSYSLYFRDLINYRTDPDFFVLLNVPNSIIDERIKYRLICPKCQTSRSYKLLPTSDVRWDEGEQKFNLYCDNLQCEPTRMLGKEGDENGIAPIKDRLEKDQRLIDLAFSLHGIPKVLLRNAVPAVSAKEYTDEYELTPEFSYELVDGKVKVNTRPWIVKDDEGVESYSLMPAAVVVSLIKQMVTVLGL